MCGSPDSGIVVPKRSWRKIFLGKRLQSPRQEKNRAHLVSAEAEDIVGTRPRISERQQSTLADVTAPRVNSKPWASWISGKAVWIAQLFYMDEARERGCCPFPLHSYPRSRASLRSDNHAHELT
jgi:hypothetical protein